MSGQINSSVQANVKNWSQVQYVRGRTGRLKGPDWQKSCTTLLAVRSERSERSRSRSRSKPMRDEISWSNEEALEADGNSFHHLCHFFSARNYLQFQLCSILFLNTSQGNSLLPSWNDIHIPMTTENCDQRPGRRASQTWSLKNVSLQPVFVQNSNFICPNCR